MSNKRRTLGLCRGPCRFRRPNGADSPVPRQEVPKLFLHPRFPDVPTYPNPTPDVRATAIHPPAGGFTHPLCRPGHRFWQTCCCPEYHAKSRSTHIPPGLPGVLPPKTLKSQISNSLPRPFPSPPRRPFKSYPPRHQPVLSSMSTRRLRLSPDGPPGAGAMQRDQRLTFTKYPSVREREYNCDCEQALPPISRW